MAFTWPPSASLRVRHQDGPLQGSGLAAAVPANAVTMCRHRRPQQLIHSETGAPAMSGPLCIVGTCAQGSGSAGRPGQEESFDSPHAAGMARATGQRGAAVNRRGDPRITASGLGRPSTAESDRRQSVLSGSSAKPAALSPCFGNAVQIPHRTIQLPWPAPAPNPSTNANSPASRAPLPSRAGSACCRRSAVPMARARAARCSRATT